MGMFLCVICDNYADSDDGCEEHPNGVDLICMCCLENGDADEILGIEEE